MSPTLKILGCFYIGAQLIASLYQGRVSGHSSAYNGARYSGSDGVAGGGRVVACSVARRVASRVARNVARDVARAGPGAGDS